MSARQGLVLILCIALTGFAAWRRGAEYTAARYEARMAQAGAVRAAENQARAEAVARAEREARETLAVEVARGNTLAAALTEQKNQLARERAAINRRIKDASERALADCRGLSAEWVGLYNDALGLSAGAPGVCSRAAGSSSASGGTAADARVARSADAGLRPNSLNTALATPEDVLAHARDYGGWCRALAAQNNALIEWGKP